MKPHKIIFSTVCLLIHASTHFAGTVSTDSISEKPVYFTENKGQLKNSNQVLTPDILYSTNYNNVSVFIEKNKIHYQFYKTDQTLPREHESVLQYKAEVMTVELIGANTSPKVIPSEMIDYYENFYYSGDAVGITFVKNYKKILIAEIYNHIDWVIYSNENGIKYDFILHPGADINDIRMSYTGLERLELKQDNSISATLRYGEFREAAPVSKYSNDLQTYTSVESAFTLENNLVGFKINEFPAGSTLIIDPALLWSTYYGGLFSEGSTNVAHDNSGNLYLVGGTASNVGIASGGFDNTYNGEEDALLVKFNPDGSRAWATYYGGSLYDDFHGVAVDSTGKIIATGHSESSGLAYLGFQESNAGSDDGLVVKFKPDGTRVWATYFGGDGYDGYYDVCIGPFGLIAAYGFAESEDLGYNGFDMFKEGYSSYSVHEALITVFNSNGKRLWCSYFGGTQNESPANICYDHNSHFIITGTTPSVNYISFMGYDNDLTGATDAYLAKIDIGGNLIWSTYYGGSVDEDGESVSASAEGNIYLVGTTESSSSIASGGYDLTLNGFTDMMIVKFDPDGNRLWSTYYGGSGTEYATCSDIDEFGNLYVGCTTSSSSFASGGWDIVKSTNSDALIAKFTPSGSFVWSSYFGGTSDYDRIVGLDHLGNNQIAFCGSAESTTEISTPGAYQTIYGGVQDAVLGFVGDYSITIGTVASSVCQGDTLLIPFTTVGTIAPGNLFKAEISGSTGAFVASPPVIGTLTGTSGGTIVGLIPSTYVGTNYKIRIKSSAPALTSNTSTSVIVNDAPNAAITPTGTITVCGGASITITGSPVGAYTYTWRRDGLVIATGVSSISASVPGTYTLEVANGSCSLISTPLVLNNIPVAFSQNVSICDGDTYILPSGIPVTDAGIYIDSLTGISGCDSIITTTLAINPVYSGEASYVICEGDSVSLPDGTYAYTAGSYESTVSGPGFCVSTTTLVSVLAADTNNVDVTIVLGDTYTLPDGSQTGTAGTYNFYLTNIAGCDSVVIIHLTTAEICDPPASTWVTNVTPTSAKINFTAVTGATNYQVYFRPTGTISWLKKTTTTTFKNLTGLLSAQAYDYRVKTICPTISSSYTPIGTFTTLPMKYGTENFQPSVFPNPNNGEFQILFTLPESAAEEIMIHISNSLGEIVYVKTLNAVVGENALTIHLENQAAGMYTLSAVIDEKLFNYSILIYENNY